MATNKVTITPRVGRGIEAQPDDKETARIVGDIQELVFRLASRCVTPSTPTSERLRLDPKDCLEVVDAAKVLGVHKNTIYRHPELPFVHKVGRAVKCSRRGIEEYLRNKS